MTRKQSKAMAALHKLWWSKPEQKKRQHLSRLVQAEMFRQMAFFNTTGVRGLNVTVYPEIKLRHGEVGK